EAEALDEAPLLLLDGRLPVLLVKALALVAEGFVERDRHAVADVCRPEPLRQDAARTQEGAQRLPLLRLARDLARVALLLRDASVVDRDRHQVEVTADALAKRLGDGREHAELGLQHLARAGAAALDEEFLRVPLADEEREVLPEDHLV